VENGEKGNGIMHHGPTKLSYLSLTCVLLAFFSSAQADEFDDFEDDFEASKASVPFDPLKACNRAVFTFNDKLYFWVLEPASNVYGKTVPEKARLAVRNVFVNLGFPVRFVNSALQGKFRKAGVECSRFAVNTSVGVLGLRDPATSWLKLEPSQEDFGQTLGHYRVGDGFPIVLPFLGPSNLRDVVGMVPDYFLAPVSYIDSLGIRLGVRAYDKANYLSLHLGEYEQLKSTALDACTFMNSAYKQHRDGKIKE